MKNHRTVQQDVPQSHSAALPLTRLFILTILVLGTTVCYPQPNFHWAKQLNATGQEFSKSIGADSFGNVYVSGYFSGTMDVDPGPRTFTLTAAGFADAFIAKLDSSGNLLWAKQIGGKDTTSDYMQNAHNGDFAFDLAVDPLGNAYLTGKFADTVDFNPGADSYNLISAGSGDIFILKLDSAGNFVWAKKIGGPLDDGGAAIALDGSGYIYTTGHFTESVDFNPNQGTSYLQSRGGPDVFVSKLDTAGNFVWAIRTGGRSYDMSYSIAVDSAGNSYTTGGFNGTTDFGLVAYGSMAGVSPTSDIFVFKLNSAGSLVWARGFGGASDEFGCSLAVDQAGNAFVTGRFQGTVDFDPFGSHVYLTTMGNSAMFVLKLDNNGHLVWAKATGGFSYENGRSITLDQSANIYLTGSFVDTEDFDPGPGTYLLTAFETPNGVSGHYDIFVSKLDSAGNFRWAKNMGGTSSDFGTALILDAFGNIYATGEFAVAADLDPGPATFILTAGTGNAAVFISKFNEASSGPLPLTLLQFSVTQQSAANYLVWQTANELNTQAFIIERGTNGINFTNIDSVPAAGNSTGPKSYSFTDANPLTGTSFYRLKMNDNDGAFTYSRTVAVKRSETTKALQLFPNPTTGQLYIQSFTGNGTATLRIVDAAGRIVRQQNEVVKDNTAFAIDVHALPNGTYLLELRCNGKTESLPFQKR
ncbi:SBBP repeat-containing protein [Flavisolibacter nicotianae]|uniref:SBBP repeat-containing protein n=1 Tax=Flavisolibacter nicotianae TaxID=2364882 RepID=UPI000EADBF40|nr:SBBP repeat-containing protein [Flavisolibacter nicotianae]